MYMNFYIKQNIHIHSIRISTIANSSTLQIGSAGIIKPVTKLENSGGFTEPAPKTKPKANPTIPVQFHHERSNDGNEDEGFPGAVNYL